MKQKVDVVGHASGGDEVGTVRVRDASDVFAERPEVLDRRAPVFGGEGDVEVDDGVGVSHWFKSYRGGRIGGSSE